MKPVDFDRLVHEYLDGRLGAAEKAEFEGLLRADADLAARVAFLRRVGEVLRHGSAELPPGFVARARSRFEDAQEKKAGLFASWPGPWKVAGLATAGVLVAALVLSDLVPRFGTTRVDTESPPETDSPPRGSTEGRSTDRSAFDDLRPSAKDTSTPSPAPATDTNRRVRPEVGSQPPVERNAAEAPDVPADRQWAASPARESPLRAQQPASAGAVASGAETPTTSSVPAGAELAGIPGGSSRIAVADGSDRREEGPAPIDVGFAQAPDRGLTKADHRTPSSRLADRPPLRCEALPSAALPEDFFAVVARADEAWRNLLQGPARTALTLLDPRFGVERVAIVGPRSRGPFSCKGSRVVSEPEELLILLRTPSSEFLSSPGGCAVVIPVHPDHVRVEILPND